MKGLRNKFREIEAEMDANEARLWRENDGATRPDQQVVGARKMETKEKHKQTNDKIKLDYKFGKY